MVCPPCSDSSNFEAGGVTDIRKWIVDICENRISKWRGIQDSETRCVLSRYQDRIYFNDLSSYKNPKKITAAMPEDVFNRMKNYRKAREKKEKARVKPLYKLQTKIASFTLFE